MTGFASARPRRTRPPRRYRDAVDVDLWLGSVEQTDEVDTHFALLDDAEQARAGRFRFERDRIRFVNRRAFARTVLAGYLGIKPAEVRIQTSEQGRPELEAGCDIVFNASHSDGMAAVAVTHRRQVGVDIERVRYVEDALDVAQGLFRECEVEALRSGPVAHRSAAFLKLWTRKESYVKAVGGGLSIPLDAFDVLPIDNGITQPHGPSGHLPFVVADFSLPPGYVGAVTLAGGHVWPRVSVVSAA